MFNIREKAEEIWWDLRGLRCFVNAIRWWASLMAHGDRCSQIHFWERINGRLGGDGGNDGQKEWRRAFPYGKNGDEKTVEGWLESESSTEDEANE